MNYIIINGTDGAILFHCLFCLNCSRKLTTLKSFGLVIAESWCSLYGEVVHSDLAIYQMELWEHV